jgi:hypothetical protein
MYDFTHYSIYEPDHPFAHALTLVPLRDFVELVTTEVSRPLRGGEALRTAD